MRAYRRLRVHLKKSDRDELDRVLNGGIQPVRVDQLGEATSPERLAGQDHRAAREKSGLERALYDKQRPGAQSLLDTKQRQRIIAMVCSDPPEGRARWTVRLIAEEVVKRKLVPKVGRETIRVLLLSHDVKPWRKKNVVGARTQ